MDRRTTLTIDEDLAHAHGERTRLTGNSFKQVVNDALRAGLRADGQPADPMPPFHVTPKPGGFRSGVDVLRLNELYDKLETHEYSSRPSVRPAKR